MMTFDETRNVAGMVAQGVAIGALSDLIRAAQGGDAKILYRAATKLQSAADTIFAALPEDDDPASCHPRQVIEARRIASEGL